MKSYRLKRSLNAIYALIIAVLAFLFFTNDFGLVDLRKTSVVIGVGLDVEDGEVALTAQLALPQPAENGENTQFNTVTGKGATVAAALNEVNVKTGFYPKLVFCKLVLLGESCLKENVTELLDYFYRNEYTGLTLNLAACKGKAEEMFSQQFPAGESATDVIDKLLSSEAQASANVCTVTLKQFGEDSFSRSSGAYMPYIENQSQSEQSGGSGGNSSGGSQGGGSQGSGGSQGGGGQQPEVELTCNKCALFSGGIFKSVLPTEQTFALGLLKNEVRHAFVESGEGDQTRVLGLRNCKGGVSLDIKDGRAYLKFEFSATTRVQDGKQGYDPKKASKTRVPKEVLEEGQKTLSKAFEALFESARSADCDVFGAKTELYRKHYKNYADMQENFLRNLQMQSEVKLKSSS